MNKSEEIQQLLNPIYSFGPEDEFEASLQYSTHHEKEHKIHSGQFYSGVNTVQDILRMLKTGKRIEHHCLLSMRFTIVNEPLRMYCIVDQINVGPGIMLLRMVRLIGCVAIVQLCRKQLRAKFFFCMLSAK
jgi:hypothetical protein